MLQHGGFSQPALQPAVELLQIAVSRHHIPVTVSHFVVMFQNWIRVYIMKRFYHHFIFRSHRLNLANNILDFF